MNDKRKDDGGLFYPRSCSNCAHWVKHRRSTVESGMCIAGKTDVDPMNDHVCPKHIIRPSPPSPNQF